MRPLEACLQPSPGFGVSADTLWTPIPGGTRLWQGALPKGGCARVAYPWAHLPRKLPVALSVEAYPNSEQGGDRRGDLQTSYMPLGRAPRPPPRCPPRALWRRGDASAEAAEQSR